MSEMLFHMCNSRSFAVFLNEVVSAESSRGMPKQRVRGCIVCLFFVVVCIKSLRSIGEQGENSRNS